MKSLLSVCTPLILLSPSCLVQSLSGSVDKAVSYLEKRLPSLTNPYAVAMTSYALASENKLNQEMLYKFSSPGFFIQQHLHTYSETQYRRIVTLTVLSLKRYYTFFDL